MSSIAWASYFRAGHLILYPPVPLASYFCAVHPLGELFSYQLFNSPPFYPFEDLFLFKFPSLHSYGEQYFVINSLQVYLGTYSHVLDDSWDWRKSKFITLNDLICIKTTRQNDSLWNNSPEITRRLHRPYELLLTGRWTRDNDWRQVALLGSISASSDSTVLRQITMI